MSSVVLLGGTVALFVGLYFSTIYSLVDVWLNNPNYSHGLLIPFVAGFLVWNKKEEFDGDEIEPHGLGLLPFIGAVLLLVLGEAINRIGAGYAGLFLQGLSLIVAISGLALLTMGTVWFKRLALPLAYLAFMVPLPGKVFDTITLPLQSYATNVTTSILQLADIPALQEGNVITIPDMQLGVVEACSGIRSLFTLLALAGAIVLVFMQERSWWLRAIFFFSAIPIAIITNAIRVTVTGFMAHYWGPTAAQGFYHDFSGWVIFVTAFAFLSIEIYLLTKLTENASYESP